jgi:hypothetical protein
MHRHKVIFVLFLASFISTTTMHGQEASLTFESDLITIGSVSKSNSRVHYLHFNNHSKNTVKLLETHVSYGYDVVYKPNFIHPNQRDSIGIRISNDLLKGPFRKVLTLITSESSGVYSIKISGNIID